MKEHDAKALQSRNPGPRSNQTNGICYHLFNAPRVKVFMCAVHVLYLQDICMVQTRIRGQQLHLLLFYLQYPHLFAWFCCILTFATFLFLAPPNMLHRLLPTLGKKPRVLLFNLQGPAACLNGFKTLLGIDFAKKS